VKRGGGIFFCTLFSGGIEKAALSRTRERGVRKRRRRTANTATKRFTTGLVKASLICIEFFQ
jgi:transcriptional regulator NrdR family protein